MARFVSSDSTLYASEISRNLAAAASGSRGFLSGWKISANFRYAFFKTRAQSVRLRVFARQAEDRVEVFGLERLARGGDRARQLRELSLDGGVGVGVTLGRAVEAVHLAAVGL